MEKQKLRLALGQIDCTVGDLKGNCQKILEYIVMAEKFETDIISFPELAITGYPPEDLLLKPKFIEDNLRELKQLAKSVSRIVVVVGFVDKRGESIYNAAAIIYQGKIKGIYRKMLLPNYGVFDEKRYFKSGNDPFIFKINKTPFGVNICEDIWHKDGPTRKQTSSGAKLIINISASPYHMKKIKKREKTVRQQAKENNVFVAYTNLVGGQDELVFDGQSIIVDSEGKIIARAEAFKEDLLITDLNIKINHRQTKKIITIGEKRLLKQKPLLPERKNKKLESMEEIYQALVLGLKDYAIKNGFKEVVIGLSGGIDSSLVATIAVDALSKDNVNGVFMPSRYSSVESQRDTKELTSSLGIKLLTISIEAIFKTYLSVLESQFSGLRRDTTEENLQARIRGNILMALSNKFGWLVLTTGNKSEVSVGYVTLYGDMAGGFSVIKDVPKTLVYKLAKIRNKERTVIPENILKKAPTAELRPNQKDTDTLPSYALLDKILKVYIEEDKSLQEIVRKGYKREIISKVIRMVDHNEYKRRQSAPGIKITPKAFGKDRRMPITNRYKG